jgi:hypothetical protein
MVVTGLTLRRLGGIVALTGAIGFGLLYLHHGPGMGFQRDAVGILPAAAALLVASRGGRALFRRAAVVGGLFGLSAAIKPHLAIGLPVVFLYLLAEWRGAGDRGHEARAAGDGARRVPWFRAGLLAAVGFLLVAGLPILWVAARGGLGAFGEMFTRYLPLYLQMNGEHEVLAGLERWTYLFTETLRGVYLWVVPALFGLYVALCNARLDAARTRLIVALGFLALVYAVYPALAGQFWGYHWMPFRYFALLCFTLCLLPLTGGVERGCRFLVAVYFVFLAMAARPHDVVVSQVRGLPWRNARLECVDGIAGYLEEAGLGPEDRVQPLEWTHGAVHALLEARAVLATRYLFTYHFHHHESHPVIREMRRRFLDELEESRPRFLVDVEGAPRPSGPDAGGPFPELEELIQGSYQIAREGRGFRVYERVESGR